MTASVGSGGPGDPEKLLADLSDIDREVAKLLDGFDGPNRARIDHTELSALQRSYGFASDAYADVHVAGDEMRCVATFHPPVMGGRPLSVDGFYAQLSELGVVAGIRRDAIAEAILACNTEDRRIDDMVVAEGTAPRPEIAEHLEIRSDLLKPEKPIRPDADAARVDFKQYGFLRLVKKGEVLARKVPKRPGEYGHTVRGQMIPYPKRQATSPKPGKNTEADGSEVRALCDGSFRFDGSRFWVEEVLDLPGGVDYRTGNISFPGDVIIRGEVKDGFSITSGASIICNSTLDASIVRCKDDLIVSHGIIGRKEALVKCGGSVRTKFIENCVVHARGKIEVSAGIMNSLVKSLDYVETGPKGIVVGGVIWAQKGVIAGRIGSQSGPKTEIHCGINPFAQERIEWIRDKNIEYAGKLQGVRIQLQSRPDDARLRKIEEALKESIHKLNRAAEQLLLHLDKDEEAYVDVTKEIAPGTYIEICHVPLVVRKSQRSVRYSLDKSRGTIIETPI